MAAPRSNRARRFDDDAWQPDQAARPYQQADGEPELDPDEPSWSTYRDAARGPTPVPDWLVTDPRAVDTDLGVMKTGKEADVSLLRRAFEPADRDTADQPAACLLAVKRYRSADHRMFHRDSGYLEGRRVRRSREMRAMTTRTAFGKELIAQQWAFAEFVVLTRLWSAGAAVPYPVQLIDSELMMEFIGTPDGVAAPRLAQVHPTRAEALALYQQVVHTLGVFADAGLAHGDLSAYNILVHEGRVVFIDVPQAVDIVGNPQGFTYLRRDCENICRWFQGHGVVEADADVLFTDLTSRAGPA